METSHPNDPNPQPSASRSAHKRHGPAFWGVIVAIVAALLAVPPFWKDLRELIGLQEGACSEPLPVTVDAEEKVGELFDYTVEFHCPPPKGERYYLVFELLNVGSPVKHPVYFVEHAYDDVEEGYVDSRSRHLHDAEVGSVRLIYVIRTTPQKATAFDRNKLPDGSVLKLPDSMTASNRERVMRGWK